MASADQTEATVFRTARVESCQGRVSIKEGGVGREKLSFRQRGRRVVREGCQSKERGGEATVFQTARGERSREGCQSKREGVGRG